MLDTGADGGEGDVGVENDVLDVNDKGFRGAKVYIGDVGGRRYRLLFN